MIRNLLLVVLIFCSSVCLHAQVLQSATFLSHRTKDQLIAEFGLPLFTNGVNLYKVTYTTPDLAGNNSVASGLLVVPDVLTKKYPLLCYQHGTSTNKQDVPSRLNNESALPILFGGLGYVTVAPDYLGLGDSPGFHPYVHAATEASVAVDMLRAAREYAPTEGVALNEQVFVTGYSQGGHAAMALHRHLETQLSSEFAVAAAAPMSGPYSIGEVMRELVLSNDVYLFPAYIPNTLLSYQLAYGNLYGDLSEVFRSPYKGIIADFQNGQTDLFALNLQLVAALLLQEGASIPVKMFQPDYLDAILNDPQHPANLALKDNNVYDWTPTAPTRLVYCTADDQVPFRNTIVADSVMHLNGAIDLASHDADPSANHSDCVFPAVFYTVLFFGTIQDVEDLPTSTVEPGAGELSVFPNPATAGIIRVNFPEQQGVLTITDVQGRVLKRQDLEGASAEVDVAGLPGGLYILSVANERSRLCAKLMIRN